MKIRIFLTVIILLLDVILLPSALKFPIMLSEHGVATPDIWFKEFNVLNALKLIIEDEKFRFLWLVSQGFVICLIVVLFWRDIPRRKNRLLDGVGGPESAGSGQHGTSRWQTEKETDETSTVWKTNEPLKKGGLVIGMQPKNTKTLKVWLDTEDSHMLILGTTRSGKTRTMLYPTIWTLAHSDESMVLSDPKGELYGRTNKYLRKKGYNVVLLDFRNPKRGNHWNPMETVIKAIEEGDESLASEMAWDIANMISPHNSKGERIWTDGQQSVCASLILAVAMEAEKREEKHLTSVYQMLIELGKSIPTPAGPYVPLNNYFDSLPTGHIAKAAFGTAALAPDRTRGSFFTGVASELKLYADPSISFLTSQQDHTLESIGKTKTAVFLIIPDENTTRHILASLYINQCYSALVKVANQNNDRLPVRTNFLLDEFGNLPPISDFDKKITVSAGRGIRYTLIIQDFQQLKKLYHDNAATITGNCHTWLYLLTTDEVTAERISKKTGKYTVETEGHSSTVQNKGSSRGFSGGITGRSLLTADEILRWPKFKALVLRARQFPAYLPLPDLSEWPADKDFVQVEEDEYKKLTYAPIWMPGREIQEEGEVAATAYEDKKKKPLINYDEGMEIEIEIEPDISKLM
ncbi:MAG: type IV secretory system conjugative DNA transfer family protein [Candidatus Bathyarchaeota archaeon]|nr:type IV secretory system conjugative DNA transfer family protein [Candidatus Bathyarchaeota archaeon]